MIGVVQLGLILAGMASLFMYTKYAGSEDATEVGQANGMLGAGIGFSVFALIFMCMIYCGYDQLKTAIDVLDASADFLAGTKRIFLVPIVYFFVQMIFVGLFLASLLSILATGDITPDSF